MVDQTYAGSRAVRRQLAAVLTALVCLVPAALAMIVGPASATRPVRVGTVSGVQTYPGTTSGTTTSIKVGWRGAAKARKYQVFVSRNSKMTSPRVITTRARKVVVSRLSLSRSYCIQVRGVNGRTYGRRSRVVCTAAQGRAGWVSAQQLVPGSAGVHTTMRVVWPRIAGAARYELDYAPSPSGKLIDIQASKSKRTLKVKGTTASQQTTPLPGLTPGAVYCFQIRPQSSSGFGLRSPRHCKVAMEATRDVPAKSVSLVVATFNTCSNACTKTKNPGIGDWRTRATAVRDRILDLRVGSSGALADVVGIQEGRLATDSLEASLMGTFTLACKSANELQSLFVRDTSPFKPDAASRGSIDFNTDFGDAAHGACWVRLEDTDGNEVVMVNVHLNHIISTAADTLRGQETDALRNRMATDFPGIPVVYLGDFNSHRNRAVDAPALSLAQDGVDDGYDQAASYLSPPYRNSVCTPTCQRSSIPSESTTWGDHVDRVFAPPGVHVASWESEARLDSSGRYILLSDHNPVLVSLLLPVN